jgi:hydrogenase nickel incorporation protein HypA/HybF
MGIATEIVNTAEAAIADEIRGGRVERVTLRVGKAAGIISEYLGFCFEIAARGTSLEGAVLHIEMVPVVLQCRTCGYRWQGEVKASICPSCRERKLDIVAGRELQLVAVDIEDEDGDGGE